MSGEPAVPLPFGHCCHCLLEGNRVQATTLRDGTALCDPHVIRSAENRTLEFNAAGARERLGLPAEARGMFF